MNYENNKTKLFILPEKDKVISTFDGYIPFVKDQKIRLEIKVAETISHLMTPIPVAEYTVKDIKWEIDRSTVIGSSATSIVQCVFIELAN